MPGLPLVSEDYFAVWELPGELFYLEASGIYSWDAMKCDFTSFKATNRSESGAAMLFLHEDGRVAFVDEDDGSLSTIGEHFSVEELNPLSPPLLRSKCAFKALPPKANS